MNPLDQLKSAADAVAAQVTGLERDVAAGREALEQERAARRAAETRLRELEEANRPTPTPDPTPDGYTEIRTDRTLTVRQGETARRLRVIFTGPAGVPAVRVAGGEVDLMTITRPTPVNDGTADSGALAVAMVIEGLGSRVRGLKLEGDIVTGIESKTGAAEVLIDGYTVSDGLLRKYALWGERCTEWTLQNLDLGASRGEATIRFSGTDGDLDNDGILEHEPDPPNAYLTIRSFRGRGITNGAEGRHGKEFLRLEYAHHATVEEGEVDGSLGAGLLPLGRERLSQDGLTTKDITFRKLKWSNAHFQGRAGVEGLVFRNLVITSQLSARPACILLPGQQEGDRSLSGVVLEDIDARHDGEQGGFLITSGLLADLVCRRVSWRAPNAVMPHYTTMNVVIRQPRETYVFEDNRWQTPPAGSWGNYAFQAGEQFLTPAQWLKLTNVKGDRVE